MSKDLSVRDLVLPLDIEESSEAGCVTLIHCPRFTGIKQSGSTIALYTFSLVCRIMPLLFQTLACSLPNAALAFAILVLTLSSMTTFWDSVLPKYVNLFTTFSLWPWAVMLGSMNGYPGAG